MRKGYYRKNYYYVLAEMDDNGREFLVPLEGERFLFLYKNNPLPLIWKIKGQKGVFIIKMNGKLKSYIENLIKKKYFDIFRCSRIFPERGRLLFLSREEDINTLTKIFKEFRESLTEAIYLLEHLKNNDILVKYDFCRNLESCLDLVEDNMSVWEPRFLDIVYTVLLWKNLCSLRKLYIGVSLPWRYLEFKLNDMIINMAVEMFIYFVAGRKVLLRIPSKQILRRGATLICDRNSLKDIWQLLESGEKELRIKTIDNLYEIAGDVIYMK